MCNRHYNPAATPSRYLSPLTRLLSSGGVTCVVSRSPDLAQLDGGTADVHECTAHPWIRLLCPAHSFSRSSNFCGLPVAVRGSSSTNSTDFGTLKRAKCVCR